ncbi:MAG: carbon starvation protein A, partial [Sedimentisphaerales bacterium]|nr:carbon starvation protein A [Sedimentisphaerales bacterium]
LYMAYPAAVIPVWFEIPIAIVLGLLVYRKGLNALWPSIIAVIIMYITVYIGVKIPVDFQALFPLKPTTILIIWIVIIFVLQSWLASSLPVWLLLQPRDFINSHQLIIAMALLGLGVLVAHPVVVAQPIEPSPVGAPPIWPFLFIIVACGAISGFHSLVSSGTSSKQCRTEKDSLFIGYGSMLMEATLATLVIAAVAAGIGMGLETSDGQMLTGVAAFRHHYTDWAAADGLSAKLNAFVTGASNMICAIRVGDYTIERSFAMTVMAVFIVSFAGTTVDTATRIQRYVIVELGNALKLKFLTRRQLATVLAVLTACALAFYDRKNPGTGAMVLWPLFGCLNQLLAGLALLVVTIFLARRRINCLYTLIPMIFMIFMTGWAMIAKIGDFHSKGNTLLLTIAIIVFVLEIWMIIEGALVFRQVYLSRKSA